MYDLIIIGSGPAGMAAGIYAGRAGLKTLIIESMFAGGQAATTYEVGNYPGFESITGPELSMKMEAHAKKYGAETMYADVTRVELSGDVKKVWTGEEEHTSRTVILAMGAKPREVGVDGERRLRGAGVSYCATCDGAFFRGKEVAVIGGGNVAVEDALYLSQFCSEVYLIHRRKEMRADKTLQVALLNNKKITPIWNSTVEEINGADSVEELLLSNKVTNEKSNLAVSGIFVAIGTIPNTGIVAKQIKLTETGHIQTNEEMQTGIDGVFAAGDIRKKTLWQIVTAVADGAIAGNMAAQYIATKEG